MNLTGANRFLFAMSIIVGVVCGAEGAGGTQGGESRETWKKKYLRPREVPFPLENVPTAAKVELGRKLFFDPRLSKSGGTSCASCHNPALAWGDGLALGIGAGMKALGRRTPTILNSGFQEVFFWDGRATSLEEQALGPIQAEGEMAMDLRTLTELLGSTTEYIKMFQDIFQARPSPKLIGKAIAAYERTIVSAPSPFDHWINGKENAISDEAKQGFDLFNGKANCAKCHTGWNFTDDGFHDIGVGDSDRGRVLHLPLPTMEHAFKTPTLRQVDQRGPYLHNGSEPTLEAVIDFYNQGGRAKRPNQSREVRPLQLSEGERDKLMAFLRTLTGPDLEVTIPNLPREVLKIRGQSGANL